MAAARTSAERWDAAYPVVRLIAALALMTIGGSGMYASIVALKPVAAEFGTSRGLASLPYMLQMLGFGLGGVAMGWASDRFGVMRPALLSGVCLAAGFYLASQAQSIWQFSLVHGLLIGFLGASATFAPLVADTSHWFTRRRGIAVAVVISGSYTAGALWPPILQHFFSSDGWRTTYMWHALFCLCAMLPLSLVLYRRAAPAGEAADTATTSGWKRPLGMGPNTLLCYLCVAGIGCCVAMAMPQVHILAYATDLGHPAQRASEMLSLMLTCGIISRLTSGWISDRIGGLRTLLLGSGLQMTMLVCFLPFDGLASLYILAALFGLSQGGIVPSYAMIVRSYFPPGEAGWRIAMVLLFTMIGMALGGWLAGALYDLTGSYRVAFVNAILFNLANMAIAGFLLMRARVQRPVWVAG